MSNSPIDSNGSDKEKMLAAFGGKKGLIDSGVPSATQSQLACLYARARAGSFRQDKFSPSIGPSKRPSIGQPAKLAIK